MFHIEKLTPEWQQTQPDERPVLRVTAGDLETVKRAMSTGDEPDLLGFGSPQLSMGELRDLADLVEEIRPRRRFWVCTSRWVKELAREDIRRLEAQGGVVLADTCLEVTPLELMAKTTGTPSGKAAVYLPSLCHQKVVLDEARELLRGGR